jgi:hypothetical protein
MSNNKSNKVNKPSKHKSKNAKYLREIIRLSRKICKLSNKLGKKHKSKNHNNNNNKKRKNTKRNTSSNKSTQKNNSEKPKVLKDEVCHNNMCMDSRVILVDDKKDKDEKTDDVMYFVNIEDKKFYETMLLDTYNNMKDKKGILVSINYRYLINKDIQKHILSVSPMVFKKYTEENIKEDPGWAKNSGITKDKPFSFEMVDSDELPKDKEIDRKSEEYDEDEFDKYKKTALEQMQSIDSLPSLKPYISTYKDLLDNYYKKSTTALTREFGIEFSA